MNLLDRTPLWGPFILLALAGLAGCGPREQISTYTVAKQESKASVSEPQRMLAAMVPLGSQAWFFKVSGPDESVQAVAEPFRQLVRSIRVAGNQLDWETPEAWTRQPASGMRFATLEIPAEGKPLELTVIPLPMPDGDSPQYRLSNVNRWRNQLGLPPIGEEQLADEVEQIELKGTTALLVELTGTGTDAGGPPFASMAGGSAGPRRPEAASAAGSGEGRGLSYATPEGWEEQPASGLRKAAFQVRDGDRQLEVTVIDLAAAGAELLPNVNRWREQLELPPTTAEALAEEMERLTIDGQPADYIELVGASDTAPTQTILVAIASRGDKAWFFKLMGDSELAARERDSFRSFLESVRFAAQ